MSILLAAPNLDVAFGTDPSFTSGWSLLAGALIWITILIIFGGNETKE